MTPIRVVAWVTVAAVVLLLATLAASVVGMNITL